MTRPNLPRWGAACAFALLGGLLVGRGEAQKPNLLVLMTDDVGIEAFGAYGGTEYGTPNIDALAATGAKFNHAYSTPLCTPSRVQLMTGQHSFRNYEYFGWLDPDEVTFTETLRDAGYRTAVAGKWQLSSPERPELAAGYPTLPNITPEHMRDHHGVDEYHLWFLNATNEEGSRYWDPLIDHNGAFVETTIDDYGPAMDVEFLNGFMADSVAAETPFVAYYPMALPHNPWVGVPDPDNPTETLGGASKTASSSANFRDNIEYLDRQVGQLVAQLDALGVRDDTLIVFTSDNGTRNTIVSDTVDGVVQGDKGMQTDAGTHVPLILNWQGTVAAAETDNLADFTDIFPTLLEAADVEAPTGLLLDGQTLIEADGALTADQGYAYNWYDPKGRNWPTGEWARNQQYKLYRDGRLFDTSLTPLEDPGDEIAPGAGSAEAEAARLELQAVLDFYLLEQADATGDDLLDQDDVDAFIDNWGLDTLALTNVERIAVADLTIDGVVDQADWDLLRGALLELAGLELPASAMELMGMLEGDFNADGVVDVADYTVWRDALDAPAQSTPLPGETATFGVMTIDDYETWRANLGATLAPAPAPEPAGVLLALLALVGWVARRG